MLYLLTNFLSAYFQAEGISRPHKWQVSSEVPWKATHIDLDVNPPNLQILQLLK